MPDTTTAPPAVFGSGLPSPAAVAAHVSDNGLTADLRARANAALLGTQDSAANTYRRVVTAERARIAAERATLRSAMSANPFKTAAIVAGVVLLVLAGLAIVVALA